MYGIWSGYQKYLQDLEFSTDFVKFKYQAKIAFSDYY